METLLSNTEKAIRKPADQTTLKKLTDLRQIEQNLTKAKKAQALQIIQESYKIFEQIKIQLQPLMNLYESMPDDSKEEKSQWLEVMILMHKDGKDAAFKKMS